MLNTHIGGVKLKLYDAIDQMPISRFHKYNKFMLIDSGVGSDLNDFDAKLAKIISSIRLAPQDAVEELTNLRMSLYLIGQEISPKFMAFAALIAEVDGVRTEDLSDEGLKQVLHLLQAAPVGAFSALFEKVKKKLGLNCVTTSLHSLIRKGTESVQN